MTESADHGRPKAVISATAAQLFVSDIKASCDFFAQKLGFSIVFVHGEPPFYARVKRGRGLLNLKCVGYSVVDPQLRDRESLLSADLTVDTHEEIEQLFLEFQAARVTFFQTLRKEARGAMTFIVQDPDGNLLLFAWPADGALASDFRLVASLRSAIFRDVAFRPVTFDRAAATCRAQYLRCATSPSDAPSIPDQSVASCQFAHRSRRYPDRTGAAQSALRRMQTHFCYACLG